MDQILSRCPKIDEKNFEEIAELMGASFLERNPIIVQRLSSLRIFKAKEESTSDCMRRIYDSYLSAQLNDATVKTRALLHLITLLQSDPLSKKIKAYLIEKIRLTPNISNLDEILAYILSQEADDVARRSTQGKVRKGVFQVKAEEEEVKDPAKKEYSCTICDKKHPCFACSYKCKHCKKKGHKSEACRVKLPEKAPGYAPPVNKDKPREPTPGLTRKKRRF